MNVLKLLQAKLRSAFSTAPPLSLLLPGAAVALSTLLPLVYLAIRAASAGNNVWALLVRDRTLEVLWNTVLLAVAVPAGTVLLAVPLAWLTVRTDLPLKRFWSIVTVLPLAIPSLVGGFTFVSAFGYGGVLYPIIQPMLQAFGRYDLYGFPGAWLVLTLLSYPYVLLPLRSTLRGLDPAQEEAARTLNHKGWRLFRRVILPQLRPAIAAGSLLVALYTLSDFAAVSLLQFDSFTRVIHVQYQASFNRTYAAVLALVLVALTLLIVLAEAWSRGRRAYYRVGSGSSRRPPTIPLGIWRWPSFIFVTVVALASVGLPAGMCLYWLIRGIQHGETVVIQWQALWNSVSVSLLAAVVTVAAALPIAIMATRYHGRLTSTLERFSYAGYALPGIVVALSLVFFGANYVPSLYQTLYLLLFAYMVLFLPQALGSLRSSLVQISPNIESAARSLGRSPLQVLWSVTLPLIRPGIITGAIMVFLTAMKELPATLLLSPTGFRTLTTHIWGATTEAYYARAALPSLILILASSLSVALLLWQENRE